MIRLLRMLLSVVVLGVGLSLLWTATSIARYTEPEPIGPAAAIVVLSGPWEENSGGLSETFERVDRGIALWRDGQAPLLVMSGGGTRDGGLPGDAVAMTERAIAAGVPAEAVVTEAGSRSTLQNAWNSARLDAVDPAERVILVTHRYHLSRAVASFRWAGFGEIVAVAADPDEAQPVTPWLLLEGVKWPLNIARAASASAALALGVEDRHVIPWLR
ncbi:MAG: YdcF family protein [Paracoccaceae bacterium]|nr:YdcF family protein [Paracoccaceae bacterium]